MTIVKTDFSGGMSCLVDITKTEENAFRYGINTRIRKLSIEPAFRHVKLNSPQGIHQCAFSNNNSLMLSVAGQLYRVKLDTDVCVPTGGSGVIDATVNRVYHQAVPAPTNWLVNSTFTPDVKDVEECVVLQDGTNRPTLVFSDFSHRAAKAFAQWTYEAPEYVPIGTFMALSGNKLFVVNGGKIYQSVSGRYLDFLLNIDNDGNPVGDADTTNLAVTAGNLTALWPAQGGGLLAFNRSNGYTLQPVYELPTIFGEPQYIPGDLFPVGAVNDLALTFVNGETLVIAPAGIMQFNQIIQQQRASNNNPYGAKVIDYLVRPLSTTASCVADDYTFIAVETIFGPAVLVHDNIVNAFAGFDLTAGMVKEFATIEDAGLTRVFYITESGLYEIPLHSGTKSTAAVLIGEIATGRADLQVRVMDVHLGFSRILQGGEIGSEVYVDKQLMANGRQYKTLEFSAAGNTGLLEVTPQKLPYSIDQQSNGLSYDYCGESNFGYSAGVLVTIGADARLAAVAIGTETREIQSATPQLAANDPAEIYFFGDVRPTSSVVLSTTNTDVTVGNRYIAYGHATAADIVNGPDIIPVRAGEAKVFTARANMIHATAAVTVYEYTLFTDLVTPNTEAIFLPTLGGLDTVKPLKALLDNYGITAHAVLGADELSTTAKAKEFYAAFQSHAAMRLSYDNANIFLFSDIPADFGLTGTALGWLRAEINAHGLNKFNIVCLPRSPYPSVGTEAADLRWPFEDIGVKLVIASNDERIYGRENVNGVIYITQTVGSVVKLVISANVIQGVYGNSLDQFTVLR